MIEVFTKNAVAGELFSSSWCNLDCSYCYIPKHNQGIIDEHRKIIRDVKAVTPVIERLKKLYGENLSILSHWGSEPSLTIKYFYDFYKKAIEEFPKLDKISFSSNFLSNTDDVIEFIKTFTTERKFSFDIQASLDGPAWITDNNRRGGSTDEIIANIVYFIEELNKEELFHKVRIHFKSTVSKGQYAKLLEDDNLFDYYRLFDEVFDKMIKSNTKRNVLISLGCEPTLVCPDDYTKQDGTNFNKLYEKTLEIARSHQFKYVRPDSGYYFAFAKLVTLGHELFTKQKMFTCSAGDSQFGISDYLHPCHDTFYLPSGVEEEFLPQDTDRTNSNHELQNLSSGRTNFAKNNLTMEIDGLQKKDLAKYVYKMRAFHDFSRQKISCAVAVIKEMAYCGQVSKCYKYDEMAELLAIYTITRHSCPTRQYSYMGSMMIPDINFFRVFGNGLVENFLKRAIKEFKIGTK